MKFFRLDKSLPSEAHNVTEIGVRQASSDERYTGGSFNVMVLKNICDFLVWNEWVYI